MSRSIKDLREIICVSRLNGIDDACNLNEIKESSIREYVHSEHKISSTHKNIKNKPLIIKVENRFGQYERWYRLIDEDTLKDVLNRANADLQWLCAWSQEVNVRAHFMNWWLTGQSRQERLDLMHTKYALVYSEVLVALRRCCPNENIAINATDRLLELVLREYPNYMLSKDNLFLDHLETLVSYDSKHLLSAIDLTTCDKHTIHYCLSIRAFALISLWSAIVRSHSQLVYSDALAISPFLSHFPSGNHLLSLLPIVINHQFIAVLQYLIQQKKVDPLTFRDSEGRNIITMSVSYKSLSTLQYILDHFDTSGIINMLSDAGNSALHLAVCQGSLEIVKILVDCGHAKVDITNPNCDNCTPIQMATLYGQDDIAMFLVNRGAKMALFEEAEIGVNIN